MKESNRTKRIAEIKVAGHGESFVMEPALNQYAGLMTPIGTPAVRTGLSHDLYLSLMNLSEQTAGIHCYHTPLMGWLWGGGAVVVLGSLIAGWPSRKVRPSEPLAAAAA